MTKPLNFAVIGIDHRHALGQAQNMLNAGASFTGWWTKGTPETMPKFARQFASVPRVASREVLLNDDSIDLALIAARPCDRAQLAIEAMQSGKHVMVDKPGCTTLDQLKDVKQAVAQYNRIWSIDFSERFEVPAVTRAEELVAQGEIGKVVNTIGIGPHRLNKQTRPDWFFKLEKYGGIICDLASHQIDQFLFFTNSTDAQIEFASVANHANPATPELQDFGELVIKSPHASGYIRVDWYTADALPTWGDGRLFLQGTEGSIELRKYCELGVSGRTDNLYLVNKNRCEYIDTRSAGLPYFTRLIHDIQNGTETAMTQAHAFKVMELALQAQGIANKNFPGGQ